MPRNHDTSDRLLTSADVALIFRVDPKTIARWASEGKIPVALRTLGGHRRFRESEIRQLITSQLPGTE